MELLLVAVGRLKAGPERELCRRYAERFQQLGRGLGLALTEREIDESPAKRMEERRADEARRIEALVAGADRLICCDERGAAIDSPGFAGKVGGWRDGGARRLAVVIGGADGLEPALRQRADVVLAFGALTMPHQLVRVVMLEQLYRVTSILAGHPYHRA